MLGSGPDTEVLEGWSPEWKLGLGGRGQGRARLAGCLGFQRVGKVGMGQAGGKFGRQALKPRT